MSCDTSRWGVRKGFLFGFIVVFAVVGGILFFGGDEEPSHEGRTLSQWLSFSAAEYCMASEEQERSADHVRAIGTNAIPFLLDWLNTPDWRISAADVGSELLWKINSNWVPDETSRSRQNLAMHGFEILGNNGASAIPELMRLLQGPHIRAKICAAESLSHIGSPALPGFLEWFMQIDPAEAEFARSSLLRMKTDIVPDLVVHLSGPIPENRKRATSLLIEIERPPLVIGEAVIRCLERATVADRNQAILSLSQYETEARAASTIFRIETFHPEFRSLAAYVSNRLVVESSRQGHPAMPLPAEPAPLRKWR